MTACLGKAVRSVFRVCLTRAVAILNVCASVPPCVDGGMWD